MTSAEINISVKIEFSPKHRKGKDFTRKGSACAYSRIVFNDKKAPLALTDKPNFKSPIQINSKYVNAEALRQP